MLLLEATKCEKCGKVTERILTEDGRDLGKIEHHPHCPQFKPFE